ncbi:Glycosyl transferase family 2 [Enhydrobacter aerosaccus]|uniref:Glycosyl transferase family 2 n=1 Tax=Enhydrobacter aerosaccus TaxID=225324 RepID=A0A1T4KIP8_9HYPH|nr:glycosyltransferase [Enhydrobacter aerosaccus]SJZ42322.1 Glycosyl transferase family 2 [Enhydrobacter aerosaccus]
MGGVPADASKPLFSIIWYGRDRAASARETLEAMRLQTLTDFELIVEDCGSTDGTLELFRAAADSDKRIRIFERCADHAGDAILSALRRCRGEYLGICPNEGRFHADALSKLQREFELRPSIGGICTDGFLINAFGDCLKQADIVALLLTPYRPFLPAAFFRRAALAAVGLSRHDWLSHSLALDLCCRVASTWGLAYCDLQIIECRDPLRQVDGLANSVQRAIDDRLELVTQQFSRNGFFANGGPSLSWESKADQLAILWQDFRALGRPEVEAEIMAPLMTVVAGLRQQLRVDHRTLRNLHRLLCLRSHNLGLMEKPIQKMLAARAGKEDRKSIDAGYKVWDHPLWGQWVTQKVVALTLPSARFHPAAPPWDAMYAELYAMAGERYETRGQIDLALAMWDRARPPDSPTLDSVACQAMLKSPTATDEALAARQAEWVRRHLGDRPAITLTPKSRNGRKIRIGYHCAFMDKDTMRNMMREVIKAHDRAKFEIYGYAPEKLPADILAIFDVWRHTPPASCSDREFVELVRSDDIDVFIELTGFSPGHRFGAMSLRCAPAQVSFLNHTGTSQVPNVDYVISDEVCIPTGSPAERYYSEEIYRLPGSFFCFDYSKLDEPPVTEAPHLKNGYVTFGCFGTGAKIGRELVEIWARLLHRVPDAVLHVQNPQLSQASDRRFMSDRFEACGIPPDRLVLEGGVDRPLLLRSYARVDISLDTWPYCGGNTIAESLWHGVPVVTYRGNRFASTYGASLVAAAGCADLVGHTSDEYIEVAAKLAADSDKLVQLRRNLRRMSLEFGLGDSKLFARRLEEAFTTMLDKCGA